MTSPKRRGRGALRFAGQFLAASVLVIAVEFSGLAIEHSDLGQIVAPHFGGTERLQVVTRGNQPLAKIEIGSPGHQRVMFRQLPKAVTGIRHGQEALINRGPGSPPDFSNWLPVAEILVLVVAIALCIAGLDHLRRIGRRRRRALRSLSTT